MFEGVCLLILWRCQYNVEDTKGSKSFAPLNSGANKKSKKKGRGGHNKKLYEVTPDCFKNMLMMDRRYKCFLDVMEMSIRSFQITVIFYTLNVC